MSAEHDPAADSGSPASSSSGEPLVRPLGDDSWESSSRGSEDSPSQQLSAPAEPFRPAPPAAQPAPAAPRAESPNMLPAREVRRSGLERMLVRLIATAGVVGIGVAIAAILASSKTQGWIIGLVVAIVSVVLSALLWSSRQL